MLRVWVQPRASRTEVVGVIGDALKVRVRGAPVDGRANDELCRFLAALLGVRGRAVVVLRGESARRKELLLADVPCAVAAARLGVALA